MSTKQMPATQPQFSPNTFGLFGSSVDYMVDAAQRTVLFWDVMRQRGDQYREHLAQTVPHVLSYEAELIIDGRTLKRPVNYGLVRIVPPEGVNLEAFLSRFDTVIRRCWLVASGGSPAGIRYTASTMSLLP